MERGQTHPWFRTPFVLLILSISYTHKHSLDKLQKGYNLNFNFRDIKVIKYFFIIINSDQIRNNFRVNLLSFFQKEC